MNHCQLSHPDLGKEIFLTGKFYEAPMDWDMIVGYNFMMETDSGVLPPEASMTLYQDDQRSWLRHRITTWSANGSRPSAISSNQPH